MAILIKNGLVINQKTGAHSFATGDVLIDGDRIIGQGGDLSARAAAFQDIQVIDASDKLVMPGFIDAHMHSNEGFEMGRYDNLPLEIWLSEVYPPFGSPAMTWREHDLRAMLVAIISLRSGVTTLQDDVINITGTPEAVDATASAFRDAGLRGWITALGVGPYAVIAMVCLIYLVLGCLLESLSMVTLTVPILFPIVTGLGFDPIWFGIFVVVATELSFITPPIGMNVFVMKAMVPNVSLSTIFRGIAPFLAADLVRLAILILFPVIALYLPDLLRLAR